MSLSVQGNTLPAPTPAMMEKIKAYEAKIASRPQIEIHTEHILHGGMYARTVRLPAGVEITGALMRVATILIVNGKCVMLAGDVGVGLEGFQVIPASKGRKQIFATVEDTEITMIFRTDAKTVEDAENEFTDESDRLLSREQNEHDSIIVTGE